MEVAVGDIILYDIAQFIFCNTNIGDAYTEQLMRSMKRFYPSDDEHTCVRKMHTLLREHFTYTVPAKVVNILPSKHLILQVCLLGVHISNETYEKLECSPYGKEEGVYIIKVPYEENRVRFME